MAESCGDKILSIMLKLERCNDALINVADGIAKIEASDIDVPGKDGLLAGINAAKEEWLEEKEKWMNHRMWKNLPRSK